MIEELQPQEIFVFGSNMWGRHLGGAAAQAKDKFGAVEGINEGLSGNTYAFPTIEREWSKRGIKALGNSRDRLYETARSLPEKTFLLTPVGIGIAGYTYDEISPLFEDLPSNIKKVGWPNVT